MIMGAKTRSAASYTARGAVVEFRGVGRSFDAVQAVRDFSLKVEAGEFLTLLGPSGSGKTTVLNMVAGFLQPSVGQIHIDSRSVTAIATEKRNIGMVFQNYSLFPHMNVAQNVAFPLKMRRAGRRVIEERVDTALDLVGLGDFKKRMPSQLSGGQRQRVAFARAIVFEPKVLLMDEPLGALDLKLRERMQIEIKHYQQQIGCTVIYVTHDQGEALTLSDRIVIMNDGRVVQVGSPEDIYDNPVTRFAAEFIGETNILTLADGADGATEIRELGVAYPWVLGAGSAFLSLRPEKIVRVAHDAEFGNGQVIFDAAIVEVVFYGDVHRYTARSAGGQLLNFKEHRSGGESALRSGETVRLSFLANEAVVIAGGAWHQRTPAKRSMK